MFASLIDLDKIYFLVSSYVVFIYISKHYLVVVSNILHQKKIIQLIKAKQYATIVCSCCVICAYACPIVSTTGDVTRG